MDDYFNELTNDEALEMLATQSFGRLVTRRGDDIDVFPINYAVNDGKIYFRSAEGTKLFTVSFHTDVVFEADEVDHEAQKAWSVVVKGESRVLKDHFEILEAEDLPIKPWIPSLKHNFVEITPKEISGRAFRLGEEPERF